MTSFSGNIQWTELRNFSYQFAIFVIFTIYRLEKRKEKNRKNERKVLRVGTGSFRDMILALSVSGSGFNFT